MHRKNRENGMRKYLIAGMAMLAAAALFCGCRTGERAEAPRWRGKAPGTAYLGDDVLWRPRENLIFHMMDQQGSGFKLRFTVRDLNTYVHAPAPVFFQVVGPDDRILARAFLEDDGVTGGDFARQDGHYDPYADFRYRQFHRANSPAEFRRKRSVRPISNTRKNCRSGSSSWRFRRMAPDFTVCWSPGVTITSFR